mgnify:CR=1 FL=1
MSVKCLPDGELPEDEKRNLAVRGLLLAATEDKYESIDYHPIVSRKRKGGNFFMEKTKNMFLTSAKELKTTSTLAVCAMLAALALILNSVASNQHRSLCKNLDFPVFQIRLRIICLDLLQDACSLVCWIL